MSRSESEGLCVAAQIARMRSAVCPTQILFGLAVAAGHANLAVVDWLQSVSGHYRD